MIKVLVTDLDGTLFYPKDRTKIISNENLELIQNFIDNNGRLVIASGRSLLYGIKVKEVIKRDIDIISFNGGCIYSNSKIIESKKIPNLIAFNIIRDIRRDYKIFGLTLMAEDGMYIYPNKRSKMAAYLIKAYYRYQKNYAEKTFFKTKEYKDAIENKNIFKILIIFGLNKKAYKRAEETAQILKTVYTNVEVAWSGNSIEITSKNVSKGKALLDYCKFNNINKEEVLVVGDSGNDISMFKEFYSNSFCMDHSPHSVKRYAKHTIKKFTDLEEFL